MPNITNSEDLRAAIIELEAKRLSQEKELREQLRLTYESIQPINLIKSTYDQIATSENLKKELINTSIGLAVGYISKSLFEKLSHSPVKKLIGTAILFGVTSTVAKNPDAVKKVAKAAFNLIRHNADRK